ncbi:MAG: hypothetical protein AAGM22_22715 [Acidobacteriota bacterium]
MILDVGITGGDLLGKLLDAFKAPFRGMERQGVKAMRKSVASEFAGRYWHTPQGRKIPWAPSKPFGRRPAGSPLGGPGGSLAQAWAGSAGGFEVMGPERLAIGVDMPFAALHRGGAGTSADLRETRIKAKRIGAQGKPAMHWRLGMEFGVWISPAKLLTEGLSIPSRPHATSNPELADALAGRLLDNLLGASRA